MKSMTKPNKVHERCDRLRNWLDSIRESSPDKLLKTANVVKAARDPNSPGHKHFTWDVKRAAMKCWTAEAEALIRKVYVIEDGGKKSPAFLSLMHDRERPGGGYRQTREVLSSKALRAQLELTAKAELRAWTMRFDMLSSLTRKVAIAAGLVAKKK